MADVRIVFSGDSRGAVDAAKDVDKAIDGVDRSASGGRISLKRLALGTVGVVGGFAAAAAGARAAWDEFSDGQKVAAQTDAVLKSTGGSAHVTADHVASLAGELLKLSGVDDEAIQSGENLLLTFKNVRNETGKGNDIFDQATRTVLDMSVAMGTDMKSSAILVGKALNDPIRGLTYLQRVGVAFTEAQRKQIKALAESGDTMKAQKIILGELTSEFGGSAKAAGETLPGEINIARETLLNFGGELVAKVVPYIQELIVWLRDHWPEIQQAIQQFWASAQPILIALGQLLAAAWPVAQKAIETFLPILRQAASVLADVIRLVTALIQGDWSKAWQLFKDIAVGWVGLMRIEVVTALNLLKDAALGVLRLFAKETESLFVALGRAVLAVVDSIVGWFRQLPVRLLALAETLASVWLAPYKAVFALLKTAVSGIVDDVIGFFRGLPARIAGTLGALASQAINPLKALFGKVRDPIDAIRDGILWVKDNAAAVWKKASDALQGPLAALAGWLQPVASLLSSIIGSIGAVIDKAQDFASAIGKVGGLLGRIPGLAAGGPVSAGQAYVVGEQGPELFIPATNGQIIPNWALAPAAAAGTATVRPLVINLNVDTFVGDRVWVERWAEKLAPEISRVAMYPSRV